MTAPDDEAEHDGDQHTDGGVGVDVGVPELRHPLHLGDHLVAGDDQRQRR